MINKGQIYLVDLENGVGSEQNGIRPCLIVSNNIGNKFSPCVIVAIITSKTDKPILPTHLLLEAGIGGLNKKSLVLCEQIRTIDKHRLKQFLGEIPQHLMQKLDNSLKASLDL